MKEQLLQTLSEHPNKWLTTREALAGTETRKATQALVALVEEGVVTRRNKHFRRQQGVISMFRLT